MQNRNFPNHLRSELRKAQDEAADRLLTLQDEARQLLNTPDQTVDDLATITSLIFRLIEEQQHFWNATFQLSNLQGSL